eukprot:6577469-Alexandrium_andersonii.AAC.1
MPRGRHHAWAQPEARRTGRASKKNRLPVASRTASQPWVSAAAGLPCAPTSGCTPIGGLTRPSLLGAGAGGGIQAEELDPPGSPSLLPLAKACMSVLAGGCGLCK